MITKEINIFQNECFYYYYFNWSFARKFIFGMKKKVFTTYLNVLLGKLYNYYVF